MEDVIWMTSMFVAGAGAGALFSYARDRNLLSLYGRLVEDLSRMIPHHEPEPHEPPAMAARFPQLPTAKELQRKAAS